MGDRADENPFLFCFYFFMVVGVLISWDLMRLFTPLPELNLPQQLIRIRWRILPNSRFRKHAPPLHNLDNSVPLIHLLPIDLPLPLRRPRLQHLLFRHLFKCLFSANFSFITDAYEVIAGFESADFVLFCVDEHKSPCFFISLK